MLSLVRRDYRMRVELLASIDYGDTGPQNERNIVIGELWNNLKTFRKDLLQIK